MDDETLHSEIVKHVHEKPYRFGAAARWFDETYSPERPPADRLKRAVRDLLRASAKARTLLTGEFATRVLLVVWRLDELDDPSACIGDRAAWSALCRQALAVDEKSAFGEAGWAGLELARGMRASAERTLRPMRDEGSSAIPLEANEPIARKHDTATNPTTMNQSTDTLDIDVRAQVLAPSGRPSLGVTDMPRYESDAVQPGSAEYANDPLWAKLDRIIQSAGAEDEIEAIISVWLGAPEKQARREELNRLAIDCGLSKYPIFRIEPDIADDGHVWRSRLVVLHPGTDDPLSIITWVEGGAFPRMKPDNVRAFIGYVRAWRDEREAQLDATAARLELPMPNNKTRAACIRKVADRIESHANSSPLAIGCGPDGDIKKSRFARLLLEAAEAGAFDDLTLKALRDHGSNLDAAVDEVRVWLDEYNGYAMPPPVLLDPIQTIARPLAEALRKRADELEPKEANIATRYRQAGYEREELSSIASQFRAIPAMLRQDLQARKMNAGGDAATVAGELLVKAIEIGAFSDNPQLLLIVRKAMATEHDGIKYGRAWCNAMKLILNRPDGRAVDLTDDGCPLVADLLAVPNARVVDSGEASNQPATQTASDGKGSKGGNISRDEANVKARDFLRTNPNATARTVAAEVGCALGLVPELAAWKAVQEQRRKGRKPKQPKAVSLTDSLAANVDRRGKVGRAISTSPAELPDLSDLIADQEADFEPSPLDESDSRPTRARRKV